MAESELVVIPTTGESLDLADAPAVGKALLEGRMMAARLRSFLEQLEVALAEEASRQGTKTLHIAGMTVEVTPKRKIRWDMDVLAQLRDAGLPEERWDELVTQVIEDKVDARVANRIAGANHAYADIIAKARTDEESPRPTVTIR